MGSFSVMFEGPRDNPHRWVDLHGSHHLVSKLRHSNMFSVSSYLIICYYIQHKKRMYCKKKLKKKGKGNHQRVSFYSQYFPSHLLILKIVPFVLLALSFPLYFFFLKVVWIWTLFGLIFDPAH